MNRWEARAAEIAARLPPRTGARLLVGSCWHGRGFAFTNALDRAIKPDAFVCLGDLSGLPPTLEAVVVHSRWDTRSPLIFCPGNHDSPFAWRVMRAKGAVVLERPGMVDLQGIRIWGWADPNRTRWGHHDAYSAALCRHNAPTSPTGEPYIMAVHDASMTPWCAPEAPLVLCGHAHVPKVWERAGTLFVRTGTAGGGGLNLPGRVTARQAMVVDVALPEHRAAAVSFVESDGKTVSVEQAI
jgi:predicted phosphodiesterase